jgi:fibronectin-binding autotransporter adhesin
MPERIYHALTHQKVETFHSVNTMVSKPSSALPFFAVALLSWLAAGSINPVSAATTIYTSPYAGGTISPGDTVVLDDGATITGPITNNGTLQFNQTSGTNTMTDVLTGSGTLSLINAGTLMLTKTNVSVGIGLDMTTTVGSGRLLIGNNGGRQLHLGNTDGGVGTLSINGGYVGNGTSYLGYEAGGQASVTVSSGTWANGAFTYVGWNGSATLDVTGGSVTGTVASIGRNLGSAGSVTVSSSGQWSLSSQLTVGEQGTGSLTIGNGGLVVVRGNVVRGASGTINLNAGGTLQIGTGTNSGSLLGGTGSLTNNGTVVFNRGNASTYTGALSGSGAVTKLGLGALTLGGTNTYAGGTLVSEGSLVGTTASLQGAITNNAAVTFNQSTAGTYSGAMSGSGSLTKTGSERLSLSGSSSYNGATAVSAGELNLSGGSIANSGVTVASGTSLSGYGSVGTIGGAGAINPGNSPGILTTPQVDPSGGTDFNLEMTGTAPTYNNASNSVNDVIRITGGTPFSQALAAGNGINIYFSGAALFTGSPKTITGGFFTDQSASFVNSIVNATYNYYFADEAGSTIYNGASYYTRDEYESLLDTNMLIIVSTVAQTANFGGGDINGQVMQVQVIPEPSTYALLGIGAMGLLLVLRKKKSA